MARLPAENARERNMSSGIIGATARRSQATNAATSAAPPISAPSTSALPQPAALARTRPHTSPSAPALRSPSPGRSRPTGAPRLSRMRASTSGAASRPIGTLSQKIHSQASPSMTAPPTSGPLATARPVIALNMPIAAPRRSGGNAAVRSAKPIGMTSAAPAPWTARAATSVPASGASAHAAEASANSTRPAA